jgi:Tfp pilus assembly protein PilF
LVRERAAYAIAGVIRCGLHRSTGNLGDAVSKRLYFAACDAVEARDWPRARSFAQQITTLRPDSAASWACLALTTAYAAEENPDRFESESRHIAAYARRALALDPHSGLAHQALAMALEMQGRASFEALEQGVKLDPEHGGLLASYARSLAALGYVRAAVEPARRSIALEPNDFGLTQNAIYTLIGAGMIAEASELQSRAERLWPDRRATLVASGNDLLFYADDARSAPDFLDPSNPNRSRFELRKLELDWRAAPARFDWAVFDRVAARQFADDPRAAWFITFSAVRMNDVDRAISWLARSPIASVGLPWRPLFWPDAAKLRLDARFFAKMAKLGLVTSWRNQDRWPDFCSDPSLPYDCKQEAQRLAMPRKKS